MTRRVADPDEAAAVWEDPRSRWFRDWLPVTQLTSGPAWCWNCNCLVDGTSGGLLGWHRAWVQSCSCCGIERPCDPPDR